MAESHFTAGAQVQIASVGLSIVGVNAIVGIPKSLEFWGHLADVLICELVPHQLWAEFPSCASHWR